MTHYRITQIEDYEPLIGRENVERIREKALPLIGHYEKKCPWIWRCHLDLSRPEAGTWKYLRRWIDSYDAVIVSCREFVQEMKPPHRVIMPAINPFNIKNRELSDKEIDER